MTEQPDAIFNPLTDFSGELPTAFTFPFCYTPHPVAIMAATQLQLRLMHEEKWQIRFPISSTSPLKVGKMFGVLVVKNKLGELGYLAAFSGKIDDENHHAGLVPPVYDLLHQDSFFKAESDEINQLTAKLKQQQQVSNLDCLRQEYQQLELSATQAIQQYQAKLVNNRKLRKQARENALATLEKSKYFELQQQLAKQSVADKNSLKKLKDHWQNQLHPLRQQIEQHQHNIDQIVSQRSHLSKQLQHKIFTHYRFLNAQGQTQDLNQIFAQTPYQVPPAGAGECAAPKLLQYAYQNSMAPIALAEFWWGAAPRSEIRQHKNYYPSCLSKCQPILGHMLQGLNVEPNPLLNNPAQGRDLPIIYQDEHIVVVNKPHNFLSVAGKHIQDSVATRLKEQFSTSEGVFTLHRLDMMTSGLLVFALSKRANRDLQKQFIQRKVKKCYVALLDGELPTQSGEITLPMCPDPYDRPRQKVCYQQGKSAITRYTVVARTANLTKIQLWPETGRTHQLRVHCAHQDGLAIPIMGDELYGTKSKRLYLHAKQLGFTHPITKQWLNFEADEEF